MKNGWEMFSRDTDEWIRAHSASSHLIGGEAGRTIVSDLSSRLAGHLASRDCIPDGNGHPIGKAITGALSVSQFMATLHRRVNREIREVGAGTHTRPSDEDPFWIGYREVQVEVSHTNLMRVSCPVFVAKEGCPDEVLYVCPKHGGFDDSLLQALGREHCVVAKPSLEWIIVNAAPHTTSFAAYVIRSYHESSLI